MGTQKENNLVNEAWEQGQIWDEDSQPCIRATDFTLKRKHTQLKMDKKIINRLN